jgi:hypothetical protein
MSLSENRCPPPIKSGAGIFRDMRYAAEGGALRINLSAAAASSRPS